MKTKIFLSTILISLFFTVACSESGSTDPVIDEDVYDGTLESLFSVNVGDSFTYQVDTLQSSGSYQNIGTRTSSISSTESSSDQTYFLVDETLSLNDGNVESVAKFFFADDALQFTADSSGVYELVPDTLELEFNLNESYKVVQFPLTKDEEWSVFKGSIIYGTFKFSVFDVYGTYVGNESLIISGFSEAFSTEKFEYRIKINIPDMENPFASNIQEYEASVWISPGYGVVKFEGCAMFINPITGNGFDIADSNKVVKHTLVSN